MKKLTVRDLTLAAMIAGLYVVLTMLSNSVGHFLWCARHGRTLMGESP